jgi:hypothetical protein
VLSLTNVGDGYLQGLVSVTTVRAMSKSEQRAMSETALQRNAVYL